MLSLLTANPGVSSGTVSASSTSAGVASGNFSQGVATTVLAHANASFSPVAAENAATIDFGIRAMGLTVGTQSFSVNNLADASGYTAALDLDSISGSGDTGKLTTNAAPFSNLAPGGSTSFSASINTSSTGSFSATYTLQNSDQNLPGAITLTPLNLTITARIALAGDADLNGTVDTVDFNIVASDFGLSPATWEAGDFDRNNTVDTIDFNLLAANFGKVDAGSAAAQLVPEPGVSVLLLAGQFAIGRRRLRRSSATTRFPPNCAG
jgi:hypothetical protein